MKKQRGFIMDRTEMALVRKQIDRDGEYRPSHLPDRAGKPKCTNCGFGSMRLADGLCRYCRHALGLNNAPEGK